jgi:cytochrome c553
MSTNLSHESPTTAWRYRNAIKLVIIVICLSAALGVYHRFKASSTVLTTEAITEQAKRTPADDRQAWMKLARAILAAESVKSMAPPTEPLSNRSHVPAAELGQLLFFDPVLSGNQRTACASCHHPDTGMADGLRKGVSGDGHGYGKQRAGTGTELARNTPSLYNVAYHTIFFWDARAGSLEEQVFAPLFAENEMNLQNVPELLRRLRAIPPYRELTGRRARHHAAQRRACVSRLSAPLECNRHGLRPFCSRARRSIGDGAIARAG